MNDAAFGPGKKVIVGLNDPQSAVVFNLPRALVGDHMTMLQTNLPVKSDAEAIKFTVDVPTTVYAMINPRGGSVYLG